MILLTEALCDEVTTKDMQATTIPTPIPTTKSTKVYQAVSEEEVKKAFTDHDQNDDPYGDVFEARDTTPSIIAGFFEQIETQEVDQSACENISSCGFHRAFLLTNDHDCTPCEDMS